MKLKALAAALAFAAAAPAAMAATCTETFSLGTMGPPGIAAIGNGFSSAQSFTDCYTFTIGAPTSAFGFTLELDPLSRMNVDILSVSLSGGSLLNEIFDTASRAFDSFSFSSLAAGTYQLAVAGNVSGGGRGFSSPVGYTGLLTTAPGSITAPVPEPETYAMLAMGLGVVGWVSRRRKQRV